MRCRYKGLFVATGMSKSTELLDGGGTRDLQRADSYASGLPVRTGDCAAMTQTQQKANHLSTSQLSVAQREPQTIDSEGLSVKSNSR